MTFQLGLVGLCTSHPGRWAPLIRALRDELDVEIAAAWDGGEVRPHRYAHEFCRKYAIPRAADSLAELQDMVDGVILHTANWDRHVEQARPFVEAGQPVLIDKPLVGNIDDARQMERWLADGKRLAGGSSLRFAPEILELLSLSRADRSPIHTVLATCGVDRFFYGIHGFAMACGLLGPGLQHVEWLHAARPAIAAQGGNSAGDALQADVRSSPLSPTQYWETQLWKLTWDSGQVAILSQNQPARLPLEFTAVSDRASWHRQIDTQHVYGEFLRRNLRYLTGIDEAPPIVESALLEPELAALAARASHQRGGEPVALDSPVLSEARFDGAAFLASYQPPHDERSKA